MLLLLLVQLLEYSLSAVILKPVGFSRINPESSFARADQKKPKHRAELFEQEIDDKETKDYALELMSKQLNLPINELVVTDYHRDQFGAIHVYLARTYNGIAVSNQNAAIHLKGSRVIAVSSSIRKSQSLSKRDDHLVDLNQAIQIAVAKYGGKLDGSVTPEIVYVESETGLLLLAYKFQLKDNENLLWFQVEVAAETGQIIRVIDFYSRSSYRAAPLPRNSALDGLNTIKNPEYWGASPKGWNSDSYRNYSDTTGNNVEARITTGQKIDGGPNLEFNTIWNPAEDPILGTNPEAALINAFYICNRVHDVAYMYGFDEIAGNFQQNNFGNGGIGGDSLIVNIQGRGLNNANFATPPDGQRPIMNLYLWNYNSPRRDSALDNQIIIHEFMHGISHRLTGGPATVGCLSTLESGGMGEGWGDIFALVLTMDPGANGNSTFEMFPYVAHSVATGRLYPYSSNMTANPLTYSVLKVVSALHQVGSLWATILFEVYWALVSKNGISLDWINPDKINAGNIVFLKIMIGAMKFQPCNPTFLQARDAILIADEEYHNGANVCPIWTAFAKRGLGSDAGDKVDGFKIPAMCQPGNPSVTKIATTTSSATAINTAASIVVHPDTSSAISVNNWAKRIRDFIFFVHGRVQLKISNIQCSFYFVSISSN